jgi:hypothetical protein
MLDFSRLSAESSQLRDLLQRQNREFRDTNLRDPFAVEMDTMQRTTGRCWASI